MCQSLRVSVLLVAQILLAVSLTANLCAEPTHKLWPSQPPADCPFEPSQQLTGVGFTGRHTTYSKADTWYPTWASDGNLYSPYTDGSTNGVRSWSVGKEATTGYATIEGDDPLKLKLTNAGTIVGDSRPYGGRYPCGALVHNGIWYQGTYCLDHIPGYNWGVLGPFVGFNISKDFSKTWTLCPLTPAKPLFGESGKDGQVVKIGAPHFVDFGKNMEHSPDGKAYLVCHGATLPDPKPRTGNLSWITGDEIYLIRVTPSLENMNDASKYEFYAGRDANKKDIWSGKLAEAKPIAQWNDNMGCVTMTYNAPLKKYIMCITDGGTTLSRYNTYLLESDSVTGPWKQITYMKHFGEMGYFVNIPSKFISKDGRTAWMSYSTNWINVFGHNRDYALNPPGGTYAMCLQEFRLVGPKKSKAAKK